MGTFSVSLRVGNLAGSTCVDIDALADAGSIHSYMPRDILEAVDVRPTETRSFCFADDRIDELPFGYARLIVDGLEVIAPVVFADRGAGPILGATTLEAAHLMQIM